MFREVTVNFDASCFSRQVRIAALGRIGHYVKKFTFSMPHTDDTFLPPLINPDTLDEIPFNYQPQISLSRSTLSDKNCSTSKYGSWELNDLLVRQYPLLFHAATNIPSFIKAISTMPNVRHLRISCPDKHQSRRRDIVDYALTSLRVAIEQSNPAELSTLSLDPIRPSSLYYLRSFLSLGTSPTSTRVWRRVSSLNMVMDSHLHYDADPSSRIDHLKVLHTYLSTFSSLHHFNFTWTGHKGPCPLSLHTEPCTTTPSSLDYSSCASSQSSSPPSLSSSPSSTRSSASSYFEPFTLRRVATSSSFRALKFRMLKSMKLHNALLDASQASAFIYTHRKTLTEFQFESCQLRSGTWDDALSPLTKMSGNESWKQTQDHRVLPSTTYVSNPTDTSQDQHKPRRPSLKMRPALPISLPPTLSPDFSKNEIFEVPLILSPSNDMEPLQLAIRDRLWTPDDTLSAFHEDAYDDTSNLNMMLSPRRRGVRALRRIGRRIGLSTLKEEIEGDVAVNGVRKLLRAGSTRHVY